MTIGDGLVLDFGLFEYANDDTIAWPKTWSGVEGK
jgi:hypothetical protein